MRNMKKANILFIFCVYLVVLCGCYDVQQIKNRIPKGEDLIVSPVEGRILKIAHNISKGDDIIINEGGKSIKLTSLKGMFGEDAQLVIVFMKPFNKHIVLSPISGEVTLVKYTPGKFKNLYKKNAYIENEHKIFVIDGDICIAVVKIAGFVFRRIISNVGLGDKINKGDELGFIKMGSAVAIVLPKECKIQVKEGEKVRVGETIIATH